MTCKYFDCGWCYAPSEISTSATPDKKCLNPDACLYLKSQMTETDISKVLIEGEYATIMGVKYKRVEEPKTPVEEAYKDWWGQYPELETDSEYDEMRWQGFQAGFQAAQSKDNDTIPSMINCIIRGNPPNGCSSWDEWFELFGSKGILHNLNISAKEYQPPKPQTLYNILYDELGYDFNTYIVDLVEDWLPEEHDTNSDGWNKCVRMLRENLR